MRGILRTTAALAATMCASLLLAGTAAPARAPSSLGAHLFTDLAGLPAGWTETWSTGALADVGDPIALSSPISADLGGKAAVVVGDRRGLLYAYELGGSAPTGTPVPGWPVTGGSGPIDSTPSVTSAGPNPTVVVGSGNDADPTVGGYQAFDTAGSRLWFTGVQNPSTDTQPFVGVEAGVSVAPLGSTAPDVVAGSLGQVGYALSATNGAPLTGWPFFNSDSTHSTAATADLYGTGRREIVVGGDQSAGVGRGQAYQNGGHLRILSATGNQICRADTNQVVDSSPAVGGFLGGGATGIVVGTGSFFAGATDSDTLRTYDTRCHLKWSAALDGSTYSSPALSDVVGNGSLQVVEGTDQGANRSGSVFALDAETGGLIWSTRNIGRVIGSVVTADLGQGYDDVIAPTTNGAVVLDGRTGHTVAVLAPFLGLQNSPLVTDDPNGTIGITLAGYMASPGSPNGVGEIDHYEIAGSNGAAAIGGAAWPMFHHDAQLSGNAGGTTPIGSVPGCSVPAAAWSGYDLAASDGGIFTFPAGGMPFCGSTGSLRLDAPVVGMAMAPATGGYWEVASDGGIFAFGQAAFYGSMGGKPLNQPVVAMAATPDGRGYWEVAADGGIFAFGDAAYFGSMGSQHLNSSVVGISSSSDGHGYRLVASDGGIFCFGDAPFSGSMGGTVLNAPVVGTTNDVNTGGYWEVAADGGVFSFGGAPFYGSTGGGLLNAPIVGQAETANGSGYRFTAADGGVFSYSAPFLGSMGSTRLNRPVIGMAGY